MPSYKQVESEQILTTIVDQKTGEILTQEAEIKTKLNISEKEPPYIKLYFNDIKLLTGLSTNESEILYRILTISDYENIVILNKYNREERILPYVKTKSDTVIRNSISKFVRKDILIKVSTGVYKLNPYLFGRGTWQNLKSLRLTINYTEQGRVLQVSEIREKEIENTIKENA